MKKINSLTKLFVEEYSASPIDKETAMRWIKPDETFVAGFHFGSSKQNYRLISLREEPLFTEFEKSNYLKHNLSPHTNMLVIIYHSSNEGLSLRIVNGIAGILNDIFRAWKIANNE